MSTLMKTVGKGHQWMLECSQKPSVEGAGEVGCPPERFMKQKMGGSRVVVGSFPSPCVTAAGDCLPDASKSPSTRFLVGTS